MTGWKIPIFPEEIQYIFIDGRFSIVMLVFFFWAVDIYNYKELHKDYHRPFFQDPYPGSESSSWPLKERRGAHPRNTPWQPWHSSGWIHNNWLVFDGWHFVRKTQSLEMKFFVKKKLLAEFSSENPSSGPDSIGLDLIPPFFEYKKGSLKKTKPLRKGPGVRLGYGLP